MNNNIKTTISKHPILFSLIIIFIFFVFTEIQLDRFLTRFTDAQSASYISGIFLQGFSSIVFVILLKYLGWISISGFTKPKEWKQLWLCWPLILLCIYVIWEFLKSSSKIDTSKPLIILLYLLVFLSTGFYEEILFRGLIMTLLIQKWGSTKKGIYLSVILSSLLFGTSHIINFMTGRALLLPTITQILYAIAFGVFFASCILRNHSIWPAILLHALFDICSDLSAITVNSSFGKVMTVNNTPEEALSSLILALPLLLYGLFILRKVQPCAPDLVC
ncbi:CPBP family intramembrane glutamic endopeptidase [Anaerosacchariphilus polymeriproducens]|uniref:CPBP family intramembrane metalloprotease n=1 Tax=Anaerosacchariphilus polymeriproducens TaxID=1812858 RepID=A0A371AUV7_9FIRM|nr:CPBP family intramembrane glutamic endopeptidase [Anaerosacchariphilus polymeriproducens]RDU23355.1 CPBP family intramembrane metalloprotease [Anaerosacchariphilus polymeriproducens]